jgi:phage shock protein PspC (stress-responsive transcriptional regulator)
MIISLMIYFAFLIIFYIVMAVILRHAPTDVDLWGKEVG